MNTIGNVIIGIIFYCIGNSQWCIVSRNLIDCSTLSQEYCMLISWYWKIMRRQFWTLTYPNCLCCFHNYMYVKMVTIHNWWCTMSINIPTGFQSIYTITSQRTSVGRASKYATKPYCYWYSINISASRESTSVREIWFKTEIPLQMYSTSLYMM